MGAKAAYVIDADIVTNMKIMLTTRKTKPEEREEEYRTKDD